MPFIIEKDDYMPQKARPIEFIETNAGCWECISHALNTTGYPVVTRPAIRKSPLLVSRYVYALYKEEIPSGKVVRHTCDNPLCINPIHLELGTQLDNLQDAIKRGRARIQKGESNYKAKLTNEDIINIREDKRPYKEICQDYAISKSTVSKIKNKSLWTHI